MKKELKEALSQADKHLSKIEGWALDKERYDEIEVKIIASYILISISHFDSIIELIKNNKRISASALARPHYEACLRATWLSTNEHTTKVKKAIHQLLKSIDDFPKLWKMSDDINNKVGINFYDSNLNKAFNSYAHGGFYMVLRCISEDTIASQFTDEEMIGLLNGVVKK